MKGVNLVHDPNAQYEYRCCQSLVMMEVLVNEQRRPDGAFLLLRRKLKDCIAECLHQYVDISIIA